MESCVGLGKSSVQMPRFGLGTYRMKAESELYAAIPAALEAGYRLIDSATIYGNESIIGEILRNEVPRLGLNRKSIFITSKLSPYDQGYEATKKAIKASIKAFGPSVEGYIDLYLIHWPGTSGLQPSDPNNAKKRRGSWRALCEAFHEGTLKAIGVSNYMVTHLEEFLRPEQFEGLPLSQFVMPMVNQIELHPAYYPRDVCEWCENHDIYIQAYSSLAQGVILQPAFLDRFPRLKELSLPIDQAVLAWAWQHGWLLIPKSTHPERIQNNCAFLKSGSPKLTEDEMNYFDTISIEIKNMTKSQLKSLGFTNTSVPGKVCWDPDVVA